MTAIDKILRDSAQGLEFKGEKNMNENRIVLVAKEAVDCYGCFFDARSGCVSNDSSVESCTGRFRKDGRDIIWVVEQEQDRLTDEQKSNIESKFGEVA